jgi:hypothetical protein
LVSKMEFSVINVPVVTEFSKEEFASIQPPLSPSVLSLKQRIGGGTKDFINYLILLIPPLHKTSLSLV